MNMRVLIIILTLGITANYKAGANQPTPSYEWIGKYSQTFYTGKKTRPWQTTWEKKNEYFSIIYNPHDNYRSVTIRTIEHPDWHDGEYGIARSITRTMVRGNGTYWSDSWDEGSRGLKQNYKRKENAKYLRPRIPTCKGTITTNLTALGKVIENESPKLFITSNDNQNSTQTWDIVLNMTTDSNNDHSCTKSVTFSGPRQHITISPCTSYLFSGFDCYNSVSIFKQ